MILCNLPHRGEGVKAKIEKWRTRAYRAHARERVLRSPGAPLFSLHPSAHFHCLARRWFAARLAKILPRAQRKEKRLDTIYFSRRNGYICRIIHFTAPPTMEKKVILLTGASSGIGYQTAEYLAKQGHRVYGAARRVEQIEALAPVGVKALICSTLRTAP